MPVIDESIVISARLEEVFAYLVDGENLPAWDSSIVACQKVGDEPVAVGTRYRGASRIMGRRIEWTTEVSDFEPGIRSSSRSVEGSLTFSATYEFHEVPGGTRLRYLLVADSGLGGAFGRVMEPLVEKAQARVVASNLVTVASLLEIAEAV